MIPLFDCHCDTIARVKLEGGELRSNAYHLDLERLQRFKKTVQVFAVCCESLDNPTQKADAMLECMHDSIKKNSDIVKLCLNFDDIETAINEGKIGALISIEGCEQITSLEDAYNKGVRILHPTWNFDNDLCGAAMGSGKGLGQKGRAFVKKAQSTGFVLDMSHVSEKGFFEVLEIAQKPVIAGHSNSKAVCDVARNLTDTQFTALVKVGGGAGLNLYPEFLGLNRDIDAVIAHLEHFLALGGAKSVFLGCDFDGIECTPKGIEGVQSLSKLYNELLRRNYNEELIEDIFFNNAYEIMRRML